MSRSNLNATYNVLEFLIGILDELPPDVVRRYVPKSEAKQLYILINNHVDEGAKSRTALSELLFGSGVPTIATGAQQDLMQVSKLISKVGKWALSIYSPMAAKRTKAWMVYDRDPRWYPDCIGRYRCKRVDDYDIYVGSRNLETWKTGFVTTDNQDFKSNQDEIDECSSLRSNTTSGNITNVDSKSSRHLNHNHRVKPRDIRVVYLN